MKDGSEWESRGTAAPRDAEPNGQGAAREQQPPDTYSRVRAACAGVSYIDLDKHAARITEVVALARYNRNQNKTT